MSKTIKTKHRYHKHSKKNGKIKNAQTYIYKGIKFKSKLEREAYKVFESNKINVSYEPVTYDIFNGFKPYVPFFQGHKKSSVNIVRQNQRKLVATTYTPDFEFKWNNQRVIVEMKGYENDVFPLKFKMFRQLMEQYNEPIIIAEIFSIGQLEKFIEILKKDF